MVEEQTVKPQSGSWDNLRTETADRKPKIEFEINKPVAMVFPDDFTVPREYPNQGGDGVFYVFDVKVSGEEKVLMSSAWSLLRGLKAIEPLAGKNVKVTKVMKDGKQHYEVEDLDAVVTEDLSQ